MAEDAPALPEGFDLAALLAPIPGDAPQGADLREDYSAQSPYFRLRDARAEAREAERRAETAGEEGESTALPPQWRTVVQLASAALTERTKDLEIAAWLTEALVRQYGLRGLTAGSLLLCGLAESFWDDVFPLPDEDGIATRVAPVTGLSGAEADGTLMPPLRRLPLFQRPDGSAFAWWQYERSEELAGIADEARRQQRIEGGTVPLEEVEKEARAAGAAHFARMRGAVADAIAAWSGMSEAMDGKAGIDGPSTSRVLNLLRAMAEVVQRFGPAEDDAPEAEAPAEDGEAGGGAVPGAPRAAAPGRSREDMLRQLVDIAEFFRRTEPNSPLAYTLQDAVRRARMTWPELITELVPDETTRLAILTSLGIKPPDAPTE